MKTDTTTLWIPMPAGKVARIRVDVLEEALPSPLEVEQAAAPTDEEMTFITHALANAEWLDAPPFDPGLPPVSHHAKQRGKERAGLNKDALERTAAKALKVGLMPAETKGALRRYLDFIGREHKTTPRVHGNHVFIFGREDCLVTVLELPHEHRNAAASALSKRPPPERGDVSIPKLWIHEGKGHYIGSLVIVAAASKDEAEALIRAELDKCGLKAEAVNANEAPISNGKPLITRSGDY